MKLADWNVPRIEAATMCSSPTFLNMSWGWWSEHLSWVLRMGRDVSVKTASGP